MSNELKKARNVRVGPLDTVGRVASELGRLYRAARRGEIDENKAAKYAYILTALRQCLEISAIEERLIELERRAGQNASERPNLITYRGGAVPR